MFRFFLALLLFFIVANPATFKLTRKVFGPIASADGLPSQLGVAVHALVFVFALRFLYRRFSGYMPGSMNPAMLDGTGYMALSPHRHKTK